MPIMNHVTAGCLATVFFFHGARLSSQAMLSGITHWRLHLVILISTFLAFPLIGWIIEQTLTGNIAADLLLGIVYVCVLPSTVQSSITLTSLAGGHVPAAICAASLSSLLGVFITPIWMAYRSQHAMSLENDLSVLSDIGQQLLLPFGIGFCSHRYLQTTLIRYRFFVRAIDQGSILCIIYLAISQSINDGIWQLVTGKDLVWCVVISCGMLLAMVFSLRKLARFFDFSRPFEIVLVLCGSKKSLASGMTMAKFLFPTTHLGVIVIPLLIYHQLQLVICTVIAMHYQHTKRAGAPSDP